ncbi:MAG: GNAT family N-acetyltransferase [Oscillospiraceae bacterium]|nr:GNAT family N-acetyltransferase [Oscillospiraceae bacterium]
MSYKLVKPSEEYIDEIRSFREEFLVSGDSMDGTMTLKTTENILDWLEDVRIFESSDTIPEGVPAWRVPAYLYLYVRESDGRVVGMIQFRHYLNDFLAEWGGHIGYCVRPSERRKGYAAAMLEAVLMICRLFGLDKVLLTCRSWNEGSRRTILKNGGKFDRKAKENPNDHACGELERYWIDLE